ncbi:hypothetical protein SERLA73DRAFT_190033 [Serpula lacrymans var. lacrymans S7.3]|uniref:Eukaryotic integral membrane protein n=2 Tax=Serpula lacrymans var. lacrymans TaxID=341189 RepID=F8QEZ0_SERL3|nr:uncharacterized protein SERLADRAFT_455615 [Serpula lacrymans var. lacrymans S7.9]EGN93153.1 hypothetical protein SERLA73DRAFT_190033 [Serpula lacrymans var. lacrymans S7.3]EGO31049.1 hypothetical protein SERLADRAFT_455615 [Serpula lacrymans var. lacrymans S7.9]
MAILSTPLQYLSSIPPVTRAFTAATICVSSLYFWIQWTGDTIYVPYLTLVPGSSLFYPWTFATSALVEVSFIELIVTLLFVPPSLRYFERLWGAIETIKFIVVCVTIPNIIAFAFNWIEYVATTNADLFLYGMQYHGQMALITGILVAYTQVIPEHQVQVLGVFKARVKRLPMAYLTFSTIMTFIGFQCPYIVIQFGWLAAWVYLRFYKKNTSDTVGGIETYGDRSETFALIYWFPPLVHRPISLLANTVHSIATRFHLIPNSASADIESGGYSLTPGGARAEAERRRALALKALDQRLASSSAGSPSLNGSSQSQPQSQPSRPPPAAVTPRPDERKASPGTSEVDLADSPSSSDERR